MGKKIFAEISKKYFGVGPVLVQGGPDLVQGGPLLVQGGPLLVQPRVSSTEYYLISWDGEISRVSQRGLIIVDKERKYAKHSNHDSVMYFCG